MLRLKKLSIYQFKNYISQSFYFDEKIIGITGNNGTGKTNLLDAIYYLCFTKSYFNRTDQTTVHNGKQGMRLEGGFEKNAEQEQIVCILRENNKKELRRNGQDYKKFSQHIGHFPAVMIAPDDVEIIIGNSDVRRKFLDTLLSQLDPQYLKWLIDYNKVLQQRNSFLKSITDRGFINNELLDTLDDQLVQSGTLLFERRKEFLETFLVEVVNSYQNIAGTTEPLSTTYYSQLHQTPFKELLETYRQKDLMLQRTTVGIHKDDIEINLHNEAFKNIASQGQRKSLLFALKLTEFETLKLVKGFAPLLLLDDVFEKLDERRMNNLLIKVCVENDGQVFITDTHKERLQNALSNLEIPHQLISPV